MNSHHVSSEKFKPSPICPFLSNLRWSNLQKSVVTTLEKERGFWWWVVRNVTIICVIMQNKPNGSYEMCLWQKRQRGTELNGTLALSLTQKTKNKGLDYLTSMLTFSVCLRPLQSPAFPLLISPPRFLSGSSPHCALSWIQRVLLRLQFCRMCQGQRMPSWLLNSITEDCYLKARIWL